MGWVLGLGFLLFRSRFCLPRRAAAHCLAHKSWAVSFVVYWKKTARDRTTLRPRKKKKNCQGPDNPQTKKKNLYIIESLWPLSLRTCFAWWLCDFALCTTGNFVTETRPYSFLCPYRLIARRLLICSAVGVTGPRLAFGSFSKKNSQGPDNPKTGKKKSNSSHCREPVALFSPYWLRLVIVRFCALHYRPFCHSDGYLTMFTACGWCHRTTTRLR